LIITIAGILLILSVLFNWRKALRALLFRPGDRQVLPPRVANPFREGGKTLLSIVYGDNVEEDLKASMVLIGGWDKIPVRGKTILVKPNIVLGAPPPTTTSPELIGATVRELYRNGASQVWVGDMSALQALPTRENMMRTGIQSAAKMAGAKLLYFEDHRWVKVLTPGGRYVKEVYVTEWIFRADVIINMPVVKTHRSASYSIALKNFVGATHGRQRPYFINPLRWEEIVAELNLAYIPHLNIVDASTIMVRGGPQQGKEEKTNLVIVSGDRIAADLAGLGLIKHFGLWPDVAEKGVWEQSQIRRAVELGLGVSEPGQIEIRTQSLLKDDTQFVELVKNIRFFLNQFPIQNTNSTEIGAQGLFKVEEWSDEVR
jgi:uncharacterized protein (DUF362 family)